MTTTRVLVRVQPLTCVEPFYRTSTRVVTVLPAGASLKNATLVCMDSNSNGYTPITQRPNIIAEPPLDNVTDPNRLIRFEDVGGSTGYGWTIHNADEQLARHLLGTFEWEGPGDITGLSEIDIIRGCNHVRHPPDGTQQDSHKSLSAGLVLASNPPTSNIAVSFRETAGPYSPLGNGLPLANLVAKRFTVAVPGLPGFQWHGVDVENADRVGYRIIRITAT